MKKSTIRSNLVEKQGKLIILNDIFYNVSNRKFESDFGKDVCLLTKFIDVVYVRSLNDVCELKSIGKIDYTSPLGKNGEDKVAIEVLQNNTLFKVLATYSNILDFES